MAVLGILSSALLLLGGLAGVVAPRRVGAALGTSFAGPRGVAEYRILNATFVGVGAWAVADGSASAFGAVGAVWLSAAAIRVVAARVDRAGGADYWAIFLLEAAGGVMAVAGAAALG